MNNFEFLSYEPVTGERFLGIATVRAWGKIILRYKIVPTKDGKNFFPAASAIKSADRYEPCFVLDSAHESKQLTDMIKEQVLIRIKSGDNNGKQHEEYQGPAKASATNQGQANAFSKDMDECPF